MEELDGCVTFFGGAAAEEDEVFGVTKELGGEFETDASVCCS